MDRKQQKDDTRKRLTAAAMELLSKRGYAGTTVVDIARRAGVAKGTFFVHFASKDAIVIGLVRAQVTAARRARERALAGGGTPVAALRAAVFELGAQAARSRELSRAVIAGTVESPSAGDEADALFGELRRELVGDARAARRAGLLAPRTDPELLAWALIASYLGAVMSFVNGGRPLLDVLRPLVDANLEVKHVRSSSRA
jgi:AcrR family transcriptional regulator